MSYNKTEKFFDYRGRVIELSESSWEHIRESHPEIGLSDIEAVLRDPLEVRQSPRQTFVELYYQAKAHRGGKIRFSAVVVKVLESGLYVSTAMTVSSMKDGKSIFTKKEDGGEER